MRVTVNSRWRFYSQTGLGNCSPNLKMATEIARLRIDPDSMDQILSEEFPDQPRAVFLFRRFLEHIQYARSFALELMEAARGATGDSWEIRRLATTLLQEHLLTVRPSDAREFSFVFRKLGLGPVNHGRVAASVLKEGYSTRDYPRFITEFRQRLRQPRCPVIPRRRRTITPHHLRKLLNHSRRECRLPLARYLFSPDEVVQRICDQVYVRSGTPLLVADALADEEIDAVVKSLPDYEAAILLKLLPQPRVFWVAAQTSSRLNSLVEYPLGTVVLVVKPPGSDYEFEFKRAGRRGEHPLSARSHVPPSHRLDGGSMLSALQYEAAHAAIFSRVYRRIHNEPAPISRIVNVAGKHAIPLQGGDRPLFDYFTNRAVYGAGFDEMRKAMAIVVRCFEQEGNKSHLSVPGEFGLTVQFLSQTGPAQAAVCGSSSFRLDLLARYLGPEGPAEYFTRGLGSAYETHDAECFADELLEEVLGDYRPPAVPYKSHSQYVAAGLAHPGNRSRADAVYLGLMDQIGSMWGTLMGMRGFTYGESFVARNVGLKSIWLKGRRQVRLIFQDHDNLVVPDADVTEFHPVDAIRVTALDGVYINGTPTREGVEGEVDCLHRIYQVNKHVALCGDQRLRQALTRAYVKTHRAIRNEPSVRECFHKELSATLGDWDAAVRVFLKSNGEWRGRVQELLTSRGYCDSRIQHYCQALERHQAFICKHEFLYRATADD